MALTRRTIRVALDRSSIQHPGGVSASRKGFDSFYCTMHRTDESAVGVVPREILVGLLIVVFTILYIQWHRQAASRDAIAYAAKIRQQEAEKTTLEDKGTKESSADTTNKESPDSDEPNTPIAGENNDQIKNNIAASEEIYPEDTSLAEDANNNPSEPEAEAPNESSSDGESNSADEDVISSNNNQWRCACEGGFLPAGMLQSLGGAEAVFNMGIGACYHTKGEMK